MVQSKPSVVKLVVVVLLLTVIGCQQLKSTLMNKDLYKPCVYLLINTVCYYKKYVQVVIFKIRYMPATGIAGFLSLPGSRCVCIWYVNVWLHPQLLKCLPRTTYHMEQFFYEGNIDKINKFW